MYSKIVLKFDLIEHAKICREIPNKVVEKMSDENTHGYYFTILCKLRFLFIYFKCAERQTRLEYALYIFLCVVPPAFLDLESTRDNRYYMCLVSL